MMDSRPSSVALHGGGANHPMLRYRALLCVRGLFATKVDLVQRGVEHVRQDVEFVGCVGADRRMWEVS